MDAFEDIIGYEGYYQINRLGQVRSIARVRNRKVDKILKPINMNGYLFIDICNDGKKKRCAIHRLVGIQFIDNPENKPEIDHIDRNKANNNLENLRWATRVENNYNRCDNVTAEQKRLNDVNRVKRGNRWISAKREFMRILR